MKLHYRSFDELKRLGLISVQDVSFFGGPPIRQVVFKSPDGYWEGQRPLSVRQHFGKPVRVIKDPANPFSLGYLWSKLDGKPIVGEYEVEHYPHRFEYR